LASPPADDVAILVARIDLAETERYLRRLTFDVRDADAARNARRVVLETLAERDFTPIESLNAEIVFGELIGNVVRHASACTVAEIALDCSGPQTILHVFDRGPGFRHTSRLPADIFAESGRGLFLIDAMTDEFSVCERSGGGSHARAVLVGRSKRPLRCDDLDLPAALAGS
jgi:anti-sigma regulatory factor (Ser/Thr protein kinase)